MIKAICACLISILSLLLTNQDKTFYPSPYFTPARTWKHFPIPKRDLHVSTASDAVPYQRQYNQSSLDDDVLIDNRSVQSKRSRIPVPRAEWGCLQVTTVAGQKISINNGRAINSERVRGKTKDLLHFPHSVAVATDFDATRVYICDTGHHRIRRVNMMENNDLTTLAGDIFGFLDGMGRRAKFFYPYSLAFHPNGDLLVADTMNDAVRRISPDGRVRTWISGNAKNSIQRILRRPIAIAVDPTDDSVYVGEANNLIIKRFPSEFKRAESCENSSEDSREKNSAFQTWKEYEQNQTDNSIGKFWSYSFPETEPGGIRGLAVYNKTVYFTRNGLNGKSGLSSHQIWRILRNGTLEATAGSSQSGHVDGSARQARFDEPNGLCLDIDGSLYISDTRNHAIRLLAPNGEVTTIAGSKNENYIRDDAGGGLFMGGGYQDGSCTTAKFCLPHGLSLDGQGGLFVSDTGNGIIRRIFKMSIPNAPAITSLRVDDSLVRVYFQAQRMGGDLECNYTVRTRDLVNNETRQTVGISSPITITNLTNGNPYTFSVVAANVKGHSPPSRESDVVNPLGAPDTPNLKFIISGVRSLKVFFQHSRQDDGRLGFSYIVKVMPGGQCITGRYSPITVRGLPNGRSFQVAVKARNQFGLESNFSTLAFPSYPLTATRIRNRSRYIVPRRLGRVKLPPRQYRLRCPDSAFPNKSFFTRIGDKDLQVIVPTEAAVNDTLIVELPALSPVPAMVSHPILTPGNEWLYDVAKQGITVNEQEFLVTLPLDHAPGATLVLQLPNGNQCSLPMPPNVTDRAFRIVAENMQMSNTMSHIQQDVNQLQAEASWEVFFEENESSAVRPPPDVQQQRL